MGYAAAATWRPPLPPHATARRARPGTHLTGPRSRPDPRSPAHIARAVRGRLARASTTPAPEQVGPHTRAPTASRRARRPPGPAVSAWRSATPLLPPARGA